MHPIGNAWAAAAYVGIPAAGVCIAWLLFCRSASAYGSNRPVLARYFIALGIASVLLTFVAPCLPLVRALGLP